jgi:uncharacterized damage-inducible protein DinB
MLRALILSACLCASLLPAHAQMNGGGAQVADGAPMTPSKSLDDMLSLLEGELVPAAKAMPADKYNFAPAAGTFAAGQGAKFEGVRTFGQQVAHLAQANYFFYMTVSGMKPDMDVKGIADLKSKDELVKALEASFAFAHRSLGTITAANAFETIKGADGMHTRTTVAAFAVAHAYDHYGQIVEYLRMNGIVPPASVK